MVRGKLITNSVKLAPHEQATVDYLVSLGKRIELLIPSHTQGKTNPDFVMDGLLWESKSSTTSSFDNLAVMLRRAVKQSPNVVVDIRRMKLPEQKIIAFLSRYFSHSRRLKRLLVVSKAHSLVELR